MQQTKLKSPSDFNNSLVNSRIVEPYLDILKELSQLRSYDTSLALKIKINQIAIVGLQSAGKSTLLEWLIGFPGILRKQKGIGSKCITLFTVDTDNKGKIRVYLQNNGFNSETDEFQESDYKGIISRYNELLEEIKEDISEDEIVIYIGGGNFPIVIKDIPGYNVETEYTKQVTRRIYDNQLKRDDTIVIYATDISKEMMVHEEIAKDLPMEKIILAFTKIDVNYKQHGDQINSLINPKDKSKKPLGFIGLIPPIPQYMKIDLSPEDKEKKNKNTKNKFQIGNQKYIKRR